MSNSLFCLALALAFEAAGQSATGMEAVASTILERVNSKHYPDTVCQVVFQPHQFSFIRDRASMKPRTLSTQEEALRVAQRALNGDITPLKATHFHTTSTRPYWADKLQLVTTIGKHKFYWEKRI